MRNPFTTRSSGEVIAAAARKASSGDRGLPFFAAVYVLGNTDGPDAGLAECITDVTGLGWELDAMTSLPVPAPSVVLVFRRAVAS